MNAARFSRVMRDLAKRVPKEAAAASAKAISKEIQKGFDRGLNPYGTPWKPLKQSTIDRGRFPPPLTDSSAGRNSVKVRANPSGGLQINVGKLYMVYHQQPKVSPRRHYPRRMFLPDYKLPQAWGEILLAEYEKAMARGIRG